MAVQLADTAALVGAVAGTVGAVAAIVAAVYAVRTFGRMGREGVRAEARHIANIRPRPSLRSATLTNVKPDCATAELSIVNPGGAATRWILVLRADTYAFYFDMPVSAHFDHPGNRVTMPSTLSGLSPFMPIPFPVASVAYDVDGNAWDTQVGIRIDGPVIDYLRTKLAPFDLTLTNFGMLADVTASPAIPETPSDDS